MIGIKAFFVLMASSLVLRKTRGDTPEKTCIFDFRHIKAYHSIFEVYDLDKNGIISKKELEVAMNHHTVVPVTQDDVDRVIRGFYFPGNSYADFSGFLHLLAIVHGGVIQFDENNQAYVTHDVFNKVAKFLGGRRATDKGTETIFRRCDVNKNRRIEIYEELLDCLSSKDNENDMYRLFLKVIKDKNVKPLLLLVKQLAKK